MAIASLIPGADISVDRLDLAVDGWLAPTIKFQASIGKMPVESEAPIADHHVEMPTTIKLTGIVDAIRSASDRAVDCWDEVRKLHRAGAVVKFVSEFGVWNECLIKTASTTQATRGLEFTLELEEIRRVGVGRADAIAPAARDPSNPAANRQPAVNTGSKAPEAPASEPVPVFIDGDGNVIPETGRRTIAPGDG